MALSTQSAAAAAAAAVYTRSDYYVWAFIRSSFLDMHFVSRSALFFLCT
jgi:hypothetical protein